MLSATKPAAMPPEIAPKYSMPWKVPTNLPPDPMGEEEAMKERAVRKNMAVPMPEIARAAISTWISLMRKAAVAAAP